MLTGSTDKERNGKPEEDGRESKRQKRRGEYRSTVPLGFISPVNFVLYVYIQENARVFT